MRTTLDLDDDVVSAAREIARQRRTTMGRVISDLARKSLQPEQGTETRNGFRLFHRRPGAADPNLDLINHLRDGE